MSVVVQDYRPGGTDVAVADGGTGVSTLADAGVLIGNGTGAVQVTGAGTSGQVLTSNGAGVDPTFQSAATPTVRMIIAHTSCQGFINNEKMQLNTTGSGTLSPSAESGGYQLATGTTDSSLAAVFIHNVALTSTDLDYDDNLELQVQGRFLPSIPADQEAMAWFHTSVSTPGANGAAFTAEHMGFLGDIAVGAIATLYASNSNGTTQTRTDIKASVTASNNAAWRVIMNGTTNCRFYFNKTLLATHTTNLPAGAQGGYAAHVGIDNEPGEVTNMNMQVGEITLLADAS